MAPADSGLAGATNGGDGFVPSRHSRADGKPFGRSRDDDDFITKWKA